MKNFIEKLISRLEEEKRKSIYDSDSVINVNDAYGKAISIVNQLAEEYKGGWIPCSECKDCKHKECENYGKV